MHKQYLVLWEGKGSEEIGWMLLTKLWLQTSGLPPPTILILNNKGKEEARLKEVSRWIDRYKKWWKEGGKEEGGETSEEGNMHIYYSLNLCDWSQGHDWYIQFPFSITHSTFPCFLCPQLAGVLHLVSWLPERSRSSVVLPFLSSLLLFLLLDMEALRSVPENALGSRHGLPWLHCAAGTQFPLGNQDRSPKPIE